MPFKCLFLIFYFSSNNFRTSSILGNVRVKNDVKKLKKDLGLHDIVEYPPNMFELLRPSHFK